MRVFIALEEISSSSIAKESLSASICLAIDSGWAFTTVSIFLVVGERSNVKCSINILEALVNASSGVMLPSVYISSINLSKSVLSPTLTGSTLNATFLIGENAVSIAIHPISDGASISSTVTYPLPFSILSSILSSASESIVAICVSGFTSSTPFGSFISPPITFLGPFTSRIANSLSIPSSILNFSSFRLRIISETSSITPSRVVNSWETPWILTDVIAALSREESKTLLKALPKVIPYPLSNGSTTNLPYVSFFVLSSQ